MQNTPRNLNIIKKLLESRNLAEADSLYKPVPETVLAHARQQGTEPNSLFRTSSGSIYAHMPDASTIRDKAQRATHSDYGLKAGSYRTVFMDPTRVDMDQFAIHQVDDQVDFRPTSPGKVALHYNRDTGPYKAGSVVAGTEAPYEVRPRVGLRPVEIYKDPKTGLGLSNRSGGVHFGSTITDVMDPSKVGAAVDMLSRGGGKNMPSFNPADEIKDIRNRLAEEAPVNNAGGGQIAGIGVGPKGEPGRPAELMPLLRRKKDFAGQAVFEVSSKLFNEMRLQKRDYQRWNKYLQEEEGLDEIREYARKNPKKPIILQDENSGCMCYAKYGKR